MQTQDHPAVVIDEILGMAVTTAFIPMFMQSSTESVPLHVWGLCFLTFRIFDVLKVPPVRQIDRWSKRAQTLGAAGFGVIADDLLAGAQALGVCWLLSQSGWLGLFKLAP
jgi:phosphatidylglycerophosphatase A